MNLFFFSPIVAYIVSTVYVPWLWLKNKGENSCSYSLASGSNHCTLCRLLSKLYSSCLVASTITLVYLWLWGYITSKFGENFHFHGTAGSVSHCTNSATLPLLMQKLKYHPFQPCYKLLSWLCSCHHLTSGCLVISPTEKESQPARGYVCASILVRSRNVLLKWTPPVVCTCYALVHSSPGA